MDNAPEIDSPEKIRKIRSDKGIPKGSRKRSKSLTTAVTLHNALENIKKSISDIYKEIEPLSELVAELEKMDAMRREIKKYTSGE